MSREPWINHDIHRIGKVKQERVHTPPVKPYKATRVLEPYPTMERLHELFTLENGFLIRKKPHHRERPDRIAGTDKTHHGVRYIRVDYKNCKADRLIAIFKGEE